MSILKVARIGHPAVRARAVEVPPDRITAADTQRLVDGDGYVRAAHGIDGTQAAALAGRLPAPDSPAGERTVLSGVVAKGPAETAGLAVGDLVLSVDGERVTTLRELYGALWKKGPGEALRLQVLRDSAIRMVEVTAGDRDAFYR